MKSIQITDLHNGQHERSSLLKCHKLEITVNLLNMYKRNYLNCLIIFNLRFFRYQYFKVDIKKKLSQQAVYVLPGLTKSEFFHWQTRLRLYQNISLGIAPGYNFIVNI